jgi:L-iditol 2-dehydrogenase
MRGCRGSDYSHFFRSVQVLAGHGDRFERERMISKEYALTEMNEALDDVEQGCAVKAVVDPGK